MNLKRTMALGAAAALPLLGLGVSAAHATSYYGNLTVHVNVHNPYGGEATVDDFTDGLLLLTSGGSSEIDGSTDNAKLVDGGSYELEKVDSGAFAITFDNTGFSDYWSAITCDDTNDKVVYDANYTLALTGTEAKPTAIACTVDIFDGPIVIWDKTDGTGADKDNTNDRLLAGATFTVQPDATYGWAEKVSNDLGLTGYRTVITVTDGSDNNLSSTPGRFWIANVVDGDHYTVKESVGIGGYKVENKSRVATVSGAKATQISDFKNTLGLSAAKTALVGTTAVGTTTANSVVAVGATVTYRIAMTSERSAAIYMVAVTDAIPAGMTYVAGSATCVNNTTACTVTVANGVVTAAVGTILNGNGALVTFKATVADFASGTKTYANSAKVTATGLADLTTNTVTLSATKPGTGTKLPNTGSSVDAGLLGLAASASVLGLGVALVGLRRRAAK